MVLNTIRGRYDLRLGVSLVLVILTTVAVGIAIDSQTSELLESSSQESHQKLVDAEARSFDAVLTGMETDLADYRENGALESDRYTAFMMDSGSVSSVTGEMDSDDVSEIIEGSDQTADGYSIGEQGGSAYLIMMGNGTGIILNGTAYLQDIQSDQGSAAVYIDGNEVFSRGDTDVRESSSFSSDLESVDGEIRVDYSSSEMSELGDRISAGILAMILVAVIGLSLIGVTVGSNTSIALRRLTEKAEKMGDGDLEVDFSTRRRDEFGKLYSSLDSTRESLKQKITEAEEAREEAKQKEIEAKEKSETLEDIAQDYQDVMEAASSGDLTRRISVRDDSKAMKAIGTTFNSMMDEIEDTIGEMKSFTEDVSDSLLRFKDTAEEVVEKTKKMDSSMAEIEEGAQQQYSYLDEVSEEMETLSSNAQQMASSAEEAASDSQEAREKGQKGQEMAEEAVGNVKDIQDTTEETMEEIEKLSESMDEIDDIVDVITEVAEQTDMIAVNASVEASRAGESGESFAVVADEIKRLAEETKESASEIERNINDISKQTEKTVDRVRETSEGVETGVNTIEEAIQQLEEVINKVETMDETIQEVGKVTGEQAESSKSVMEKVDKVSDISQRTSSKTEEVNEVARDQMTSMEDISGETEKMSENAKKLKDLVDQFKVEDDN